MILATVLLLVTSAETKPAHQWARFPPGTWAQYQVGNMQTYTRGAITLVGAKGTTVELLGSGTLGGESGVVELGLERPSSSPAKKIVRKEVLTLGGKPYPCEVVEWTDAKQRSQEWICKGLRLPLKLRWEPIDPTKARVSEWTATQLAVPMFIGSKQIEAVRYEGTNGTVKMRQWLSADVPGEVVVRQTFDAKGLIATVNILEAYGTKGKPPGADVAALHGHPWARHPIGAWVKTRRKQGSNPPTEDTYSLRKADRLTCEIGQAKSPGHPSPLGTKAAAADPTAAFTFGASVTIGGEEVSCLLFTFKGIEANNKTPLTQSDCISPFARIPIYSESVMTLLGVTATTRWTASTLEVPTKAGDRTVGAVTRKGKQTLSNGGSSEMKEVLSADVPGWLVRTEWSHGGTITSEDDVVAFSTTP